MKKDSKKNKEREEFEKEFKDIINSDVDNLTPEQEKELAQRLEKLLKNAPKRNPFVELAMTLGFMLLKIVLLFIVNISVFGFMQKLITYHNNWCVVIYCISLAVLNVISGMIIRIFIKHPLKYAVTKNIFVLTAMIVADITLSKWFMFDYVSSLILYFIVTGVLVSISFYFITKKLLGSR